MKLNFLGTESLMERTAAAFADPQPGDVFDEFLGFWVIVINRSGDQVMWMESAAPATLPEDGVRFTGTVAQFSARFAYSRIPGHTVKLSRRGMNVTGWEQPGD